jgi:hypothetical protein
MNAISLAHSTLAVAAAADTVAEATAAAVVAVAVAAAAVALVAVVAWNPPQSSMGRFGCYLSQQVTWRALAICRVTTVQYMVQYSVQ